MKIREYLNEKLITLGNKRPSYNNIVIISGGSGSGKSFVKDKLLGIEGKSLDVDALKKLAMGSIKFA
jgi:ABC-type lipoprotein export system ATPase subunit